MSEFIWVAPRRTVRALHFDGQFDLSFLNEGESVVYSSKNKLAIIRDKTGNDIASVKVGFWIVRDIHDLVVCADSDFKNLYSALATVAA